MQVVNSFRDVKCELLAVVPRHLDLHVVQETPEGATRAIFKHDAQVGLSSAGAEEEHDVWMADDFHDCTLVLEFLKLVLLNNLAFDLLDRHHRVLPATAVNDAISAFRQLSVVAEISERNLVVLNEGSSFI